jgi:phosphonate transport system substrate-binding protein
VEFDAKVFSTTEEIQSRLRQGQLDAVALNTLEYRQAADVLDSSQVVSEAGPGALEQYIILAKRDSGIRQLGDLQGRRLAMLKTPKMCLAPAWLSTILDEGHHSQAEQFFGSVTADSKPARVVLPVFFGQADACLTSKRGFDTMCELNPQVARDLSPLASSPPMVINFYVFRKSFQSVYREKLLSALSSVCQGPAGHQLSTLFQFNELMVRDAGCLASALSVIEQAERVRVRRGAGASPGRGKAKD